MLKKVTVLLIIFTLVISFSMTAFASDSDCEDLDRADADLEKGVIYTPTCPSAYGYPEDDTGFPGNGQGPHNPIYVAGD